MDPQHLQLAGQSSRLEIAEQRVMQSVEPAAACRYAESLMRELANPLEAINNLVFVAMEDAADAKHVLAYMEMAQLQLERLNELARRTGQFCQSLKPE